MVRHHDSSGWGSKAQDKFPFKSCETALTSVAEDDTLTLIAVCRDPLKYLHRGSGWQLSDGHSKSAEIQIDGFKVKLHLQQNQGINQ